MNNALLNNLVSDFSHDDYLKKNFVIISNKVKCKNCGEIIESETINDFKRCSCGKIAIDGGKEYLKRIGNEQDYIELSEIKE